VPAPSRRATPRAGTRREKSKTAGSARGKRARLGVDERRAQLVQLGLEAFATRSYDAVSVDDLARVAGVSKGLVYHYFPTKRDFYVGALDHAAQQLLDETLVPDRDLSAAERLRRGLETYLDFVDHHRVAFVALMRGGIGADPKVTAILERTRDAYVARMLDEVPGLTATPLVRTALRGWVGFVEAVATEWVTKRDLGRDEVIGLLEATLLSLAQAVMGRAIV
jgi:AcrR family transcriptional regulator